MIYLDNAATTRVDDEVVAVMTDMMTRQFGNSSSLHHLGVEAEQAVIKAKQQIAQLIGCKAGQVVLTSGATEANNIALQGAVRAYTKTLKSKKIITTAIEHASVYEVMRELEKQGYEVIYVSPRNGEIVAEDIISLVDSETLMVSVMAVNNETGAILPLAEIVKGVRQKNPKTIVHSDCVQALGKISIDVTKLDLDLATFSGHKIHGPKGIGGLYVKSNIRLIPLYFGGKIAVDKAGLAISVGTENVPAIVGFGKSCEIVKKMFTSNTSKIQSLYGIMKNTINKINGIMINSPAVAVPHIINFSVLGAKSEILLHYFEQQEIYVSTGSACSRGAKSRVLKAMSCSDRVIDGAIRVSFSEENTEEDINSLINCIKEGIIHYI